MHCARAAYGCRPRTSRARRARATCAPRPFGLARRGLVGALPRVPIAHPYTPDHTGAPTANGVLLTGPSMFRSARRPSTIELDEVVVLGEVDAERGLDRLAHGAGDQRGTRASAGSRRARLTGNPPYRKGAARTSSVARQGAQLVAPVVARARRLYARRRRGVWRTRRRAPRRRRSTHSSAGKRAVHDGAEVASVGRLAHVGAGFDQGTCPLSRLDEAAAVAASLSQYRPVARSDSYSYQLTGRQSAMHCACCTLPAIMPPAMPPTTAKVGKGDARSVPDFLAPLDARRCAWRRRQRHRNRRSRAGFL